MATAGGKRKGAGRPSTPEEEKKISYALKLRRDQIVWLQGKYKAAQLIGRLIDQEIKREEEEKKK
jgi:hypothetical protein